MMDKLHLFLRTARKSRSERNCSGFFLYPGIIKRCTPLGSKCTPHRPFGKWYRRIKRKKLYGDHFGTTVEPVFVKRYGKTLVNRGFCKKKLDTRFDTHCIKTGVQLWSEWGDLNPRPLGPEPSALPAALHPVSRSIIGALVSAVKENLPRTAILRAFGVYSVPDIPVNAPVWCLSPDRRA